MLKNILGDENRAKNYIGLCKQDAETFHAV